MYYATFDSNGNRLASYHSDIHTQIPSNAIRISDTEQQLYATNLYIRGANGKPEKKPIYKQTDDILLAEIRLKRNKLLADCDWTQLPDSPLTLEQKEAWQEYRRDLRDFPTICDLNNPVFPTQPS